MTARLRRRRLVPNYAVLRVDRIIGGHLHPGSPPRPEMVIDAIMKLQEKIAGHLSAGEMPNPVGIIHDLKP
jgi:NADH:ubiquinone oxidoreductase subunit B-like Fe-S oxidoreductase